MSSDILKYLSTKVQGEIDIIRDDLARGTAKDHGDYKYACGVVRGFMVVNGMIAELAQRLESDDE